jgi:hypothetical protein
MAHGSILDLIKNAQTDRSVLYRFSRHRYEIRACSRGQVDEEVRTAEERMKQLMNKPRWNYSRALISLEEARAGK